MDLDEVAVELRSRDEPEAIDLGMAVGRHFWRSIIVPWLIVVGAMFAVMTSVAVYMSTLRALLVTLGIAWLLKPAYDRLPLFVVSRGLFGDVPSVRRTLRHVRSRMTSITTILDWTVRRLSPYRGFVMPIRELEGASDEQYKDRKQALLRDSVRGPAIILTVVALAAEGVIVGGFAAFVRMLVPSELETNLMVDLSAVGADGSIPTWFIILSMVAYFTAVTLVEIFYVSGSFGLYINRRIELEGWDIELQFRRMARRFRSKPGGQSVGLLIAGAVAAMLAMMGLPGPAGADSPPEVPMSGGPMSQAESADEAPSTDQSEADPQETIDGILEDEEFGHTEKQWTWEPRSEPEEAKDSKPIEPSGGASEGSGVVGGLAQLIEFLLWGVAAFAVVGFAYLLIRKADLGSGVTSVESPEPSMQPTVEKADDSAEFHLPTELVQRASEHWQRGERAEALSLLYRGTIRGLSSRHGIDIAPSMTARECTRRVREAGGPADYMSELARAWTSTAYADRPPTDETAEELFVTWRRHFGGHEG